MKRSLLLCGLLLFIMSSCSGQTEKHNVSHGMEISSAPSTHSEDIRVELTEEELLDILLFNGVEAIPDNYSVSQCQMQEDELIVSAITIQTNENTAAEYKVFLRIEKYGDADIFLLETPATFKADELVVSTLSDIPIVGIAGKSEDTLSLYFYSIKGDAIVNYSPDDWSADDDRVIAAENYIIITGARELDVYPGQEPVLFQIESDTEYSYAVVNEYEWYTDGKEYELKLVRGSWVLRMIEEQYARLYNTYDAHPFDESIPSTLEQHIDVLFQKPWRLPLPEDYAYLDSCNGDLNGDGLEDTAVIIEQRPGMSNGSRMVYVMLASENGLLRTIWQNSSHLLGRGEGGVWGDPYDSISIYNGELTISHHGGSSDRWAFSYSYAIKNGELVLARINEFSYSTLTANGVKATYDIASGLIEERSETYEGDPYNGLLLSTYTVEPGQILLFTDAHEPWELSVQNSDSAHPPLPSLYRVRYGERDWEEPSRLSASQALDIVIDELYPSLMKQNYPYSTEIMENYKTLLCYEIPSYYYTDGSTMVFYRGQSDLYQYDELYHYICVLTPNDDWGTVVRVNDLTGMIEND